MRVFAAMTTLAMLLVAVSADAGLPDTTGPTITPRISPRPNNGWYRRPVTIKFACDDFESGVQACPAPVTLVADGAGQTVNVQATDMSNNVSSLTLTLNLDFAPPSVAFATAPPASTGSSSVTLSATVADALSGLDAGYCNGQAATIAAGTLSCTVDLYKGHNAVFVQVFDVAGNATSLSTLIARTGAASALKIQPEQLTLLVNDERPIQVVGDVGQVITAPLTWTSTDTDIAHVDTTDGNVIVATDIGSVTLTASDGAFSASLDVTVLAGTSVAVGTAVWGMAPLPDRTFSRLVQGASDAQGPTILTFARPSSGEGGGTLLALGPDGSRKWDVTLPDTPSSDVMATPDGGAFLPNRLTRMGPPGSGVLWRARAGGGTASATSGQFAAAVGPGGTVVAVIENDEADQEVISLAADTGAVQWSIPLPHSSDLARHIDCSPSYPDRFDEWPAEVSVPVVDDQGTAFVFVTTSDREFDYQSGGVCEKYFEHKSGALRLLTITASGNATWATIESYDNQQEAPAGQLHLPAYTMATIQSVTPLTGGGALAIRNQFVHDDGNDTPSATIVSTYGTDSDMSFSPGLDYFGDVLLGEDYVAYSLTLGNDLTGLAFDVRTGSTLATFPDKAPGAALAGGNVLLGDAVGWAIHDASGTLLESAPYPPGDSVYISGALWVSASSGSIVGTRSLALKLANSPFPFAGGVGRTNAAATPMIRNFSSSAVRYKKEECEDGLDWLPPAPGAGQSFNYYGSFDGVKPPTWSGDWYKANRGVRVNIEADGSLTRFGTYGFLPCLADVDSPSNPLYGFCGGRKAEPGWSTAHQDWADPRPPSVVCTPPPWWHFW